jgi:hypothetical protein
MQTFVLKDVFTMESRIFLNNGITTITPFGFGMQFCISYFYPKNAEEKFLAPPVSVHIGNLG